MSVCNVIACADCGLKANRPANCPIVKSQTLNEGTIVTFVIDELDVDAFAGVGVNCFKSNKYDLVRFVQCSCPNDTAVFTESSMKKSTQLRVKDSHEIINGDRRGEGIPLVS